LVCTDKVVTSAHWVPGMCVLLVFVSELLADRSRNVVSSHLCLRGDRNTGISIEHPASFQSSMVLNRQCTSLVTTLILVSDSFFRAISHRIPRLLPGRSVQLVNLLLWQLPALCMSLLQALGSNGDSLLQLQSLPRNGFFYYTARHMAFPAMYPSFRRHEEWVSAFSQCGEVFCDDTYVHDVKSLAD
jgi:hypothetical protein